MNKEFFKKRAEYLQSYKGKVGLVGVYRFTIENEDGSKEEKWYHNIIPTVCLELIANHFTDASPANQMLITHAALGDDDTPVSITDTTLGNEVYRNAIASKTSSNGIIYATAFFSQTEVTGSFKECGIFADGTSSPNTGVLISHVNIDVNKSNVQKLTIDYTIELLNI